MEMKISKTVNVEMDESLGYRQSNRRLWGLSCHLLAENKSPMPTMSAMC